MDKTFSNYKQTAVDRWQSEHSARCRQQTKAGEPEVVIGKGRKPTVEEAEAILTLVRGGWLRIELIDHSR